MDETTTGDGLRDPQPPYIKSFFDEELLGYFAYGQLPDHLREVSRPFGELAFAMAERLPSSFARTTALRKLLEAKDAAVRAATRAGEWTVSRTIAGGPGDTVTTRTCFADPEGE